MAGELMASHPASQSLKEWAASEPLARSDFSSDAAQFSGFWQRGLEESNKFGPKSARTAADRQAADFVLAVSRAGRHRFLERHARALYEDLTAGMTRHVRVEELVYAAASRVPGLVPAREIVEAEARVFQKDKDGHEIDQGILLNRFLADRACGLHLCHTMLRPRPESLEALARLDVDGRIGFNTAIVERKGNVSIVTTRNPRYLNAEDETTLAETEIAVDLALLDPKTEICVLRGSKIETGKYQGQAVFNAGINLTHLYQGKISFLWYIVRDMGFVNKLFRGLAGDALPDDEVGLTAEKPWVAAVETFAIGGGCQILLVMDYVLAASDAYMTLPARKEGIIPGLANLRLPRFVGDRIARQAIMYERRIDCGSPEGRLICDEIVPPETMDEALAGATSRLTSSGPVSAASNRRAFRIGQEPLDLFRSYMAVYAREQAYCHFSPALISNLETHWKALRRS